MPGWKRLDPAVALPNDDIRRIGTANCFVHRDNLATIKVETDATGGVGLRDRYTAYGEQIAVASGTCAGDQRGFTGQRHDPDTGLIDLHARWYDPALGRFTSADWFDPVDESSAAQGATIGWLASPVGTNRYAYAGDDPVNKSDVNGHEDADSGGFWGAISSFFSSLFGGSGTSGSNGTGGSSSSTSGANASVTGVGGLTSPDTLDQIVADATGEEMLRLRDGLRLGGCGDGR